MVTIRIEATNRWDALALTRKLVNYRWYLFEPDLEHWDVCIPLGEGTGELPDDLRERIVLWLDERRLPAATIRAGSTDYAITH
jgi:hypothetical protein